MDGRQTAPRSIYGGGILNTGTLHKLLPPEFFRK